MTTKIPTGRSNIKEKPIYQKGLSANANGTLTMGEADFARDPEQLKLLKEEIMGELDDMYNTTTGKEYAALTKAVHSYWSGADAEAFLTLIDSKTNQIKADISDLKKRIDRAMDDDMKNFNNFQDKNAKFFTGK